jgi:hypothetical protein
MVPCKCISSHSGSFFVRRWYFLYRMSCLFVIFLLYLCLVPRPSNLHLLFPFWCWLYMWCVCVHVCCVSVASRLRWLRASCGRARFYAGLKIQLMGRPEHMYCIASTSHRSDTTRAIEETPGLPQWRALSYNAWRNKPRVVLAVNGSNGGEIGMLLAALWLSN